MNKIAFILYPDLTLLDLIGVYDPLTRLKTEGIIPNLQWDFCSYHEEIRDQFGLQINPTRIRQPLSGYDLIIVPGGPGSRNICQEEGFLQWIQTASETSILASVCTGSFIFAAAGFLENKSAATHPSARDELSSMGQIMVLNERVVEDGRIITSGGVTASIDLGLYLVEKFTRKEQAQIIRQKMDYPYTPNKIDQSLNRTAHIQRETGETRIVVDLNLDGSGQHSINTGLPFFNHMLTQVAVHGLFDLHILAKGDLEVDPHHTIEDIGIVLGMAFSSALGDKHGIHRMASALCPMDDSLAQVVVDFSGRPYATTNIHWNAPTLGNIPVSLFPHFFESLATHTRCNLHIDVPYGKDDHHQVEAIFKAFGRAFHAASRIDPARAGQIPSSKGKI